MKKFILTMLLALTAVFSVNAQTQSNYAGSSKFMDNISVGVVGGVETNLNQWNWPQGAVAGIVINKEITPVFGVTLEGTTGINNITNWNNGYRTSCSNAFDTWSVMIAGRVNLTNAIWKYNGKPRKFEVETNTGIGYGNMHHAYHIDGLWWNDADDFANHYMCKLGLNLNYNVTDAWTITLRPAVIYSLSAYNGCNFDTRTSVAQLTAGIVYHFKTSNGTRSFNKAKLYDQAEVDMLNGKINTLQKNLNDANATIEVMRDSLTKTNTLIETNNITKMVYPKIQFKKGTDKIESTSMANIYDIADALKDVDGTIKVTGYASTEGSTKYNKELSLKRAVAVKNALIKAGVDASKIKTIGAGPVNKFSPDNLGLNRIVTTEK